MFKENEEDSALTYVSMDEASWTLKMNRTQNPFSSFPLKKIKKPIRFLRVENDMRNFNAITSRTQLFAHVSLSVLNYIFSLEIAEMLRC